MYVSRTVSVKKRACNFSVKIKVLNFEIKFSGYYKKSVKFLDLFFKFIKSGLSTYADTYTTDSQHMCTGIGRVQHCA